jgi:hypothetical protein
MLRILLEVKISLIQKHQQQNNYMSMFNAITPAFAQMAMTLKFHVHGRDSCIYLVKLTVMEKYILLLEQIHSQTIAISHKLHIHLDHLQILMLTFSLLSSTLLFQNNISIQLDTEQIFKIKLQLICNFVMIQVILQLVLTQITMLKNITQR